MAALDITVLSLPVQFSLGGASVTDYVTRVRQLADHLSVATPLQRRSVSFAAHLQFRVRGTLLLTPDIPAARMVFLYDEDTRMLWGKTMSDPVTGAFEFRYVPGFFKYTALAVDHTEEYRAEAHDGLIPEPMP